jgi:hypothetical protein
LADFYITIALMAQSCYDFSLFIFHVLASNLGTPVLTTQWRQKHRLAEKSKKICSRRYLQSSQDRNAAFEQKNKSPAGFFPPSLKTMCYSFAA